MMYNRRLAPRVLSVLLIATIVASGSIWIRSAETTYAESGTYVLEPPYSGAIGNGFEEEYPPLLARADSRHSEDPQTGEMRVWASVSASPFVVPGAAGEAVAYSSVYDDTFVAPHTGSYEIRLTFEISGTLAAETAIPFGIGSAARVQARLEGCILDITDEYRTVLYMSETFFNKDAVQLPSQSAFWEEVNTTLTLTGQPSLTQGHVYRVQGGIYTLARAAEFGEVPLPTGSTQAVAAFDSGEILWGDMQLRSVSGYVKLANITLRSLVSGIQLDVTTDKTTYALQETVYLQARVADLGGNPINGNVTYEVEETYIGGSMPGSNGQYSYAFSAPATPGNYKVVVTAVADQGTKTAETWITVSSGSIAVDATSIDLSLPTGGVASQPVRITNVGAVDLRDVQLTRTGDIANWVSFASSDIGWDAGSSSFFEIPASGDTDRDVIVTVSVPEGETPTTRYAEIEIVALGGESFLIPVTVMVTEVGGRSGTKWLADNAANGWDVYNILDYTDSQGLTTLYTIRSNPITLNKNVETEVGRFDISHVDLSSIDPWGGVWIEWSVLTEGITYGVVNLKVDLNGREEPDDLIPSYYTNYVFCDKKETDNIVKMTYYGSLDSVVLDDIRLALYN